VQLSPLISEVMPLRELDAAVGMLASNRGHPMRIVLEN
jgi:hypothetical protein